MKLVEFIPNEPQELMLGSEISPVKLSQGAGCLYTLSDGRLLHLANREAASLGLLNLQPGEAFRVCLHQQPGGIPYWDMWLSPETEKARAEAEAPELERQLAASLAVVQRRNSDRRPVASADTTNVPVLAPTGTEGPAPVRKPAIAAVASGKKAPPGKTPYRVALREIVAAVVEVLDHEKEQWNESSKQDLCSTLFIQAAREGRIAFDFEEAA